MSEMIQRELVWVAPGSVPLSLEEGWAGILSGPRPRTDCPLSDQSILILQMLAEGRTDQQIADELGKAPSTIKGYIRNIFFVLKQNDRAGVVATAFRKGWLR